MVFSSVTFLCVFLPVVVLLHTLVRNIRVRNAILLVFSLFFYAWGEPVWILAMLLTVAVNYVCALLIGRAARPGLRRLFLALGVLFSLAFLFYFKYSLFTLNTARQLLGMPPLTNGPALPIGISFYTFQVLTYTADVYRGKCRVQKNPLLLLLYVSFFPQLIAGPIVKYADIEAMLTERTVTADDFAAGFPRFVLGLFRKVLLANLFATAVAALPTLGDGMSVLGAWLLVALFGLQVYFDFAGYSDMAIGIGRMCGFRIKENFNDPYIARSISEFWRRWHISLGAFFREYVYIPLGGNRVGKGRTVCNLLLVWTLTGLWHGASWNYVAWGVYYGLLIVAERLIPDRALERVPSVLRRLATLLLVLFSWALFYYERLPEGIAHIGRMFGAGADGLSDPVSGYVIKKYAVLLLAGVLACLPLQTYVAALRRRLPRFDAACGYLVPLASAAVLLLCMCFLVGQSFNPFLYFRF